MANLCCAAAARLSRFGRHLLSPREVGCSRLRHQDCRSGEHPAAGGRGRLAKRAGEGRERRARRQNPHPAPRFARTRPLPTGERRCWTPCPSLRSRGRATLEATDIFDRPAPSPLLLVRQRLPVGARFRRFRCGGQPFRLLVGFRLALFLVASHLPFGHVTLPRCTIQRRHCSTSERPLGQEPRLNPRPRYGVRTETAAMPAPIRQVPPTLLTSPMARRLFTSPRAREASTA